MLNIDETHLLPFPNDAIQLNNWLCYVFLFDHVQFPLWINSQKIPRHEFWKLSERMRLMFCCWRHVAVKLKIGAKIN